MNLNEVFPLSLSPWVCYRTSHTGQVKDGVVFKGRIKRTGCLWCKEEDIRAELSVLEQYSHHDNIVDFYGSFLKKQDSADEQLWIVMEVGATHKKNEMAHYYAHNF